MEGGGARGSPGGTATGMVVGARLGEPRGARGWGAEATWGRETSGACKQRLPSGIEWFVSFLCIRMSGWACGRSFLLILCFLLILNYMLLFRMFFITYIVSSSLISTFMQDCVWCFARQTWTLKPISRFWACSVFMWSHIFVVCHVIHDIFIFVCFLCQIFQLFPEFFYIFFSFTVCSLTIIP